MLQDYSRLQFTSLPADRLDHAYRMFLDLELDVLMQVISRELERQREVEILFSDAGARQGGYGEFEELRLQPHTEAAEDGQFQITSHQIKQLTEKVDGSDEDLVLRVTSTVDDKEFDEDTDVLQISSSQLEQLNNEIETLENSISSERKNEDYREDFYEAISGVNKSLESAQAGAGDEVNTTFAPIITSTAISSSFISSTPSETSGTPPSPKHDAVEDAAVTASTAATAVTHTSTGDGLELSISWYSLNIAITLNLFRYRSNYWPSTN